MVPGIFQFNWAKAISKRSARELQSSSLLSSLRQLLTTATVYFVRLLLAHGTQQERRHIAGQVAQYRRHRLLLRET